MSVWPQGARLRWRPVYPWPCLRCVHLAMSITVARDRAENGKVAFIRGQHHRQAPRRPRSSDLLKPGQIRAQHLAVEEQQGRQCLTMRGDRNLALVRQPGQKCLDFAAAQGCRVTHTVETDEGTNPVDISLFGS